MIEISKEAAEYIRKKIPDVCIKKTMLSSGSKRGTYFVQETSKVKRLIEEFGANANVIEEYPASK